MSQNPLVAAYKKPALYVSLPSGGRFYTEKPKLSVDGELAVYAMTARDELISKTPDALFNGEATVSLIKSCCPDIADARIIPVNDLKTIMVAIRLASYGNTVDVDVQCPKCNTSSALTVDISTILANQKPNNTPEHVTLKNGFEIGIKPYTLDDRTLLQIQQIKQQKMIQGLIDSDVDDMERNRKFGETFVEIAELTVQLIANCVVSVKTDGNETVSDSAFILEWLQSITKDDYETIKTQVEQLSEDGFDTKFQAKCNNEQCLNEWETNLELDIANFFAG